MRQWWKEHTVFSMVFLLYLGINLCTLTIFPQVGIDEGFFAKGAFLLSQYGVPMIDPQGSYLGEWQAYPFIPLNWGFCYVSGLALVGKLFGFGIFPLRAYTLWWALLCLWLTYHISLLLFSDKAKATLSVLLLMVSLHFMVHVHFVRPEMMLTATFLGLFLLTLQGTIRGRRAALYVAAVLAGSAASIHPCGIFFPVIFLVLLLYLRRYGGPIPPSTLVGCLLAVCGGGLFYMVFDVLPMGLSAYWQQLHHPEFDAGQTTTYKELLNLPRRLWVLSKQIWTFFFTYGGFHSWLWYLGLYVFAFIGGCVLRHRGHTILCLAILLLFSILVSTHANSVYHCYFLPFFAILLASVLFEWQRRVHGAGHKALRACVGMLPVFIVGSSLLHSISTVLPRWKYHDYWPKHLAAVRERIGREARFIASEQYSLGLLPTNHYFIDPIEYYDLRTFIAEQRISYFVLDSRTVAITLPRWRGVKTLREEIFQTDGVYPPLNECAIVAEFPDFVPLHGGWQRERSIGIRVLDCRALWTIPHETLTY